MAKNDDEEWLNHVVELMVHKLVVKEPVSKRFTNWFMMTSDG